tara:strand:+ start:495 stop:929 length:435 start_codon:yes stop_codon:yes gene_type:complete
MSEEKNEKFEILIEYIKDLSIETPSLRSLTFVRDNIKNYIMDIDISSLMLQNKALEVTTKLTLQDKKNSPEKAFFEIKYSTVIKIDESVTEKNIISKIVLCDLQKKIYPKLEKTFVNLIKDSGYPNLVFEKKVDFEKLYQEKFN